MSSSIVKPNRDTDFYVLWSDNSDAPLCWGTRAELEEDWKQVHSHHGPWDPERVARADLRGTSAMWPSLTAPAYGWDDDGFVYEQRGWLRRDRLAAVCARISAGEEDMDLLDPLDGDWPVRPRLTRDTTKSA